MFCLNKSGISYNRILVQEIRRLNFFLDKDRVWFYRLGPKEWLLPEGRDGLVSEMYFLTNIKTMDDVQRVRCSDFNFDKNL